VAGKQKKKGDVSLEERRAKAVSLYAQGLTYEAIGRLLGISKQVAFQDVREARARYSVQIATDLEGIKNEKLAELAELKRQGWIGWRRSLRDKVIETTEVGTSAGKEVDKSRETVEGKAGNPKFIHEIREAIKQECEILGIRAPIQIQIEMPAAMVPIIVTTREEIQTLKRLQEDLTSNDDGDDGNTIDVDPAEESPQGDISADPPSAS
jgi:DNA-binding CsgD family transcriptional regulator